MLDAATLQYLRKLFKTYYERHSSRLLLPNDYAMREFAAQLWGMKGYVRHLSFKSRDSFEQWVVEKAPRHLYYSSAVYAFPAAQNMDEKGWLGADLTFDIDADHLPQCKDRIVEVVDETIGIKASFAPDECISIAAWETLKLYDVLRYELGFSPSSIRVEFSGHRGFHVTVDCSGVEECLKSDSMIRREIVDYIRAELLDPTMVLKIGLTGEEGKKRRLKIYPLPPRTGDPGVRGRVARIMERLAKRDNNRVVLDVVRSDPIRSSKLYRSNRELVEEYITRALEEVHIEVDTQVTLDVKRLVRIPYSLHGKSGLLVVPVQPSKLEGFEENLAEFSPFKSLGSIRIRMRVDVKGVSIMGHYLNLSAGNTYRLPAPLAVYLMAKEVAVLAR